MKGQRGAEMMKSVCWTCFVSSVMSWRFVCWHYKCWTETESLMGWSLWGFSPCLYFACLARVDWLASNHFYSSSFVVVAWVECFNVFALMYLFFKVKYVFGTADFQYFVRSDWWKLKINMVQGQVFVVPVWGSYTFV